MNIREIREQSGLSQSKFADKFMLSVRTLQQWEQGRSTPPEYVTQMIQRLLMYEEKLSGSVVSVNATYSDCSHSAAGGSGDFSLSRYRLAPRKNFKICIDNPFRNCELIYPIQQRKVQALINDICSNSKPEQIIIFGSSITEQCHIGSDVDIYAELSADIRPITDSHDFEYDFWNNFTIDARLKSEIFKKGVVVYG